MNEIIMIIGILVGLAVVLSMAFYISYWAGQLLEKCPECQNRNVKTITQSGYDEHHCINCRCIWIYADNGDLIKL